MRFCRVLVPTGLLYFSVFFLVFFTFVCRFPRAGRQRAGVISSPDCFSEEHGSRPAPHLAWAVVWQNSPRRRRTRARRAPRGKASAVPTFSFRQGSGRTGDHRVGRIPQAALGRAGSRSLSPLQRIRVKAASSFRTGCIGSFSWRRSPCRRTGLLSRSQRRGDLALAWVLDFRPGNRRTRCSESCPVGQGFRGSARCPGRRHRWFSSVLTALCR